MALPKPVSRADMYLSYLNYTKGLTLANLPKPVSRADMYLYNLCINRGIGGGSGGSNVTLNGEPQTNFNFIENKVVQDGLVYTDKTTYTSAKKLTLNKSKQAYEITFKCRLNLIDSSSTQQWFISESNGAFRVGIKSNGLLYIQRAASGAAGTTTLKADVEYIVTLRLFGNKVSCFLNGKEECSIDYDNCESTIDSLWVLGFWDGSKGAKAIINGLQIYTRPLALAEIQHNLSVLNNSPSIKELHTTDSEGKTSILKLGSDSSHVEMDTGRTLQEELDAYRAIMAKEFISTDGTPIEVNNAFKSKVLGMSIKGQTLKNYCGIDAPTVLNKDKISKVTQSTQLNASKYDIVLYVDSVVGICTVAFYCEKQDGSHFDIIAGNVDKTGLYKFKIDMTYVNQPFTVLNVKLTGITESPHISLNVVGVSFVEENLSDFLTHPIPFGLSSTEAIISNTGEQYPIYANEEDKANKKVISLGSTPTKKDTLEIKDDGSAIYTQNTKDADDGSARIDLPAPIMTHIDKSLLPTIITQQTNTIEVGGAVKTSSFKVTVPVDAIGELRAEINEIKKQLGAVAALQLGQIN